MMNRSKLKANCFCLAIAVSAVIGCGSSDHLDRAQVTGTVTLDGKPLEAARILFRPEQGRAGRGEIKDGQIVNTATYELDDGIVLGKHKIAIQPVPEVAPITLDLMAEEGPRGRPAGGLPKGPGKKKSSVKIPPKYQRMDRSGLTAEITDGDNELTIELTSK